MKYEFDSKSFAEAIKMKRVVKQSIGIREAAETIGTSPATLSRCENLRTSEIDTFLKICSWLNSAPNNFIKTKPTKTTKK